MVPRYSSWIPANFMQYCFEFQEKTLKQFSFLYVGVHNFSEIAQCPMNPSSEGLSYNIRMQTQFALTLSSCSDEQQK